jgi:hypothetical protein
VAVGDGREAGLLEDAVDAAVEVVDAGAADAQTGGGLDSFIDGEFLVGDGELRDVADFPKEDIKRFKKILAEANSNNYGVTAAFYLRKI